MGDIFTDLNITVPPIGWAVAYPDEVDGYERAPELLDWQLPNVTTKHLPGQHNQQSHNPYKGNDEGAKVGTSKFKTFSTMQDAIDYYVPQMESQKGAMEEFSVARGIDEYIGGDINWDSALRAMYEYTGEGFAPMNAALRGKGGPRVLKNAIEDGSNFEKSEDVDRANSSLMEFVQHGDGISYNLTLYRAIEEPSLAKAFDKGKILGDISFRDFGWSSTSLLPSICDDLIYKYTEEGHKDNFVLLEIHAPKGTKALMQNVEELEVTLLPHTKYKVIGQQLVDSTQRSGEKIRKLVVDIVPEEPKW